MGEGGGQGSGQDDGDEDLLFTSDDGDEDFHTRKIDLLMVVMGMVVLFWL